MSDAVLRQLMAVIADRKAAPSADSYTRRLLDGGVDAIGAKILEEARDVVGRPYAHYDQRDRGRDDQHAKAERRMNEPVHLPAPNSVPNNSAAPSTTIDVPTSGPLLSTANSSVVNCTLTR